MTARLGILDSSQRPVRFRVRTPQSLFLPFWSSPTWLELSGSGSTGSGSTMLAQQPALLAFPVPVFFGRPFIRSLLTSGQSKLDFRSALTVKIYGQRHNCHAFPHHCAVYLVYLTPVKQQFPATLWFVIIKVAVAPLRDIGVDQPKLVILHLGIAFGNHAGPEAQRFDLCACQHDASLELLIKMIIIARAPVLDDDLLFIKFQRTRLGHYFPYLINMHPAQKHSGA